MNTSLKIIISIYAITAIDVMPADFSAYESICSQAFGYDFNIKQSPGLSEDIIICCHGYGGNSGIISSLRSGCQIKQTLLAFNFPDHDFILGNYRQLRYGSPQEILPLLFILKLCVIDNDLDKIILYGFSAGGGAIINALALLHTFNSTEELQKIGITPTIARKILNAIEKGMIILDCPLKSLEEIMDLRIPSDELRFVADQYDRNKMRPIDALLSLKGLSLKYIIILSES